MKESWNWDRLPTSFLDSAYLNIDNDAIASHLNPKSKPLHSESQLDVTEGQDVTEGMNVTEEIDVTEGLDITEGLDVTKGCAA